MELGAVEATNKQGHHREAMVRRAAGEGEARPSPRRCARATGSAPAARTPTMPSGGLLSCSTQVPLCWCLTVSKSSQLG